MSNARCFILDECRKDTESVKEYGKPQLLFPPHRSRSSVWGKAYDDDVLNALEACKFDPKTDYLVAAGHLLNVVRACTAMVQRYGKIRMLFFYGPEQKYRAMQLG